MSQERPDMDESSYIENILRLNLGKVVSVYMNFENSQWGSKIFKGKLEAAGKDHIMNAYEHAVKERYRFFSYGDAMFIKG